MKVVDVNENCILINRKEQSNFCSNFVACTIVSVSIIIQCQRKKRATGEAKLKPIGKRGILEFLLTADALELSTTINH